MILFRHWEIKMISDGNKIMEVIIIQRLSIVNFKGFVQKFNIKNKTMIKSALHGVNNYKIYSRDSIITINKAFANIDSGSQGVTHQNTFLK